VSPIFEYILPLPLIRYLGRSLLSGSAVDTFDVGPPVDISLLLFILGSAVGALQPFGPSRRDAHEHLYIAAQSYPRF
jgi:hypothetical protein